MSENRRLPIFLALDVSGSMDGEPIQAVREGVRMLLADLKSDPMAMETAYLSIITFESVARQIVPLTDINFFLEPKLEAGGGTSMGEALTLLERCLDSQIIKPADGVKGDYRPLIFLMTDGLPTDSWEAAADSLKKRKVANIIACAAGPRADGMLLKRVTEIVVELNSLSPDTLKAFFLWVSDSIKVSSASIGTSGSDGGDVTLPPPPPAIKVLL